MPKDDDDGEGDLFAPIGKALPRIKPPSRVKRRLIESATAIADDDPESLLFQHAVFCQVGLPYRDPGDDIRIWRRSQGHVQLEVQAGRALDPERDEFIDIGLPWGAKPRLVLAHLNAEALKHGSPEIEVGDSLTEFVKDVRGFKNGHEIRAFKGQLTKLSTALVRIAMRKDRRAVQVNTHLVTGFELWADDERQRTLWPSIIRLSADYFESLQKHAVPLDKRALTALAHSAMALDAYTWLAQRLHRVEPQKPQCVSWKAIKDQFGWHYERMRKFREVFRRTLGLVLSQYRSARVELNDHGMTLRHSPPPVKGRLLLIGKD
jgi:Plasmid encoded RepA protein